MQTTPGISSLQMTMSENSIVSSHQEFFRATMRRAQKTDWDLVIAKIDKQISRAGAVVLTLSVLYFTSIFISMMLR